MSGCQVMSYLKISQNAMVESVPVRAIHIKKLVGTRSVILFVLPTDRRVHKIIIIQVERGIRFVYFVIIPVTVNFRFWAHARRNLQDMPQTP